MRNQNLSLLLISIAISTFSSCKGGSAETDDYGNKGKTNSIYDLNNYLHGGNYDNKYGILYRSIEQYDILPIADLRMNVSTNHEIKAGYNFEFFNYKGELQINNKVLPNIFASNISSKIILKVVDYENVLNHSFSVSEEFGQWGKATIINDNPQRAISDIIVTPLASKYLSEHSKNDTGTLIFVRFEQNDGKEYKDYLFYGSTTTGYIVKNNYSQINTVPEVSSGNGTNSWKTKP